MSDGDSLTMTVPFSRGCKARSSLPIGRSSSQSRESVGVLYLQYGDETKQIRMPAEINSVDTLRALFVTAFPQQLTMKKLQSPNMAIYIKDTRRNVYFDLEDIRNITSHSCLKVYHKDPSHVFNRHTRPPNAEGRISKEVLYGSHSPVHRLSSSSRSTLQSLQGSMSPPMVRSMPSSPSRMAYGGRGTQGLVGGMDASSTTLPRDRLSGAGRSSSLFTSSSAILERRDVKPDEDAGSCKSMAVVVHGEGGPRYPDSYCSSLQDGGRSSYASSQCSGSLSHATEMVDTGVTGILGGLQQYRASIKPLMGYGDIIEQHTQSLHRQKSRKYGDSQLPQLATPPPSPQRLNEVRMNEGQIIGGVGLVSPERMSPVRRSLRRESSGGAVEMMNRSRGSGSSTSSVFMDSPLGQAEMLIHGHMNAFDAQSERMKAMEEQIASLAGLVHNALSVGGDIPRDKDLFSGSAGKSHLVPPEPQVTSAADDVINSASLTLQAPTTDSELQQRLVQVKSNVSELRLQLNQLRHLQISQQQSMRSMLQMASQELVLLMCDRLVQSEERTFGRRAEIEEERIQYLATEEKILKQLSELEDYVNHLQTSAVSLPGQLPITLRDVEEGAVNLRRVGETLAILKGEFPELQVKMRSVLRLEMDAVRFLKEEPHKMDYMLKRVKALTEALSSLRRCVSESTSPSKGTQVESLKVSEADQEPPLTNSPQSSPQPQPRASVRGPQAIASSSLTQPEPNYAAAASPVTPRRVKTTPATVIQAHQHSPPLNPTHGRDLPTVAKVSPRSREGSPALQKRAAPLQSNELHRSSVSETTQESHTTDQVKSALKTTARPVEKTERESPEGSLSQETSSVSQPSVHQTNQASIVTPNLDQVLQEAQASLMNSIPDLDLSDTKVAHSDLACEERKSCTSKTEMEKPLDTLQALVSGTQDKKNARQNDEVDSSQLKPIASLATVEPPPSASPSASPGAKRSIRPQMEKPRRSSVEKKQSPDRSGQSSPALPRRLHAATVGLTTGRTGDVIYTSRKESGEEQGVSEKEPSINPQPKPLRQPPEVKPKPKSSGTAPVIASENIDDEEDDGNRFLKELQVFQKCTKKELSVSKHDSQEIESKVTLETSGNDQLHVEKSLLEGQEKTPPKCEAAGQKHILPLSNKSAPHLGSTNGRLVYHSTVVVPEEVSECRQGPVSPDRKEDQKMVQQGSITRLSPEKSPNVAPQHIHICGSVHLQKVKMEDIKSPDKDNTSSFVLRCNQEFLYSPTKENTMLTTIASLQQDKPQSNGTAIPGQMDKNDAKQVQTEDAHFTKTLQKENISEYSKQELLNSNQDTRTNSDLCENQEVKLQLSGDKDQCPEEEGSLSPDIFDDGGPPPPPPPSAKIAQQISKMRVKTQSKNPDLEKMKGSDIKMAAGEATEQTVCQGFENHGFEDNDSCDREPIIVFNEYVDLESDFKRLSTIFEYEEDLDRFVSPEGIKEEEETTQKEIDEDLKNMCEENKGLDLNNISDNGQHSHSHTDGPLDENQDRTKPELIKNTETNRKFKFKFPKKTLSAISQAIRSGTTKTGKTTLEVEVVKEEMVTLDQEPVKAPKKQNKDSSRFKSQMTKQDLSKANKGNLIEIRHASPVGVKQISNAESNSPVKDLCKKTYSIGSLDEPIKLLEISTDSLKTPPPLSSIEPSPPPESTDGDDLPDKVKQQREGSPSKRPASHILKNSNSPQSKRVKAQPPPDCVKPSTKKQTSSSCSQRTHSRLRHSSPSSGSPDNTTKVQQQASSKQPSQADSRGTKAAGDSNHSVVALRASKIPALCHNSGKHPSPSTSLSTPHCSDATDSLQTFSSSSSFSSASSPTASSASSFGKQLLSSSPSKASMCASRCLSSPCQRSKQAHVCPPSCSSGLKNSINSPQCCSSLSSPPSTSPPPHKSLIPSLNLSRLLPSSSKVSSASLASGDPATPSLAHRGSGGSSKRQHRRLTLATAAAAMSQLTSYSSSSYSSSSPSSSSTSSSLSPTSSSSSPLSPSSSFLQPVGSHGGRSGQTSVSNPTSPKKFRGTQSGAVALPTKETV
ncbi:sickle tail protein isoform X2 [Vanacampus margaritifer]